VLGAKEAAAGELYCDFDWYKLMLNQFLQSQEATAESLPADQEHLHGADLSLT
jgi:protein AATF/BFR2